MPPAESGLVVRGDAKALAVLDFDDDGWPDFLVSRNNDTAVAFRNRGVAGSRPLKVTLNGSAGNPAAVGARVTVERASGSTETTEIYAGSGYYTQSTAACFFGCPNADSIRRLRVRWPSGKTTEHDVSPDQTTLSISHP